jgi:hypothetical protein
MSIAISDTSRIIQYSASAAQTDFTIPFVFLADGDIKAYKRGATDTPDDTTDLLTITTDYTLAGAGNASGGTLTLTSGATLNDVITIVGDDAIGRSSYYTTDVSVSSLNQDFEKETIFNRLNETVRAERMLSYPFSAVVADKDRELPNLEALEGWRMNAGETALEAAVMLEEVVDDTTPQLGGDLDLNGHDITGSGEWQGDVIGISYGGTGATTAAAARAALSAQEQDNKLDNIIANSTSGLLTQTSGSTIAARTVTGTASQITVTNGDGVSGNPTLSISSTFTFPGSALIGTTPTVDNSVVNKLYADNLFAGTWVNAILGFIDFTTSEPAVPTLGDRYITTASGTSSVTAQSVTENYIYQYNGATWTPTTPTNGMKLYDAGTADDYIYNGSDWVVISSGSTFLSLADTPSAYSTAHALYKVNSATDAVVESTATVSDAGTLNIPAGQSYTIGGAGIPFSELSGICSMAQGGIGINASPGMADGKILIGNTLGGTFSLATITGTSNQVNVNNGGGSITLSLPQSIAAASSPTFTGLTLSGLANDGPAVATSGVLSTAAATDGQLYIGGSASNDMQLGTITAGSGIAITNGTNSVEVAVTATSGMTKLATVTAANDGYVCFTGTHITSTYNIYKIFVYNVLPTNYSVGFYCRLTTDDGSTWINGAGTYGWAIGRLSAGTGTYNNSDTQMNMGMAATIGNLTNEHLNGEYTLYAPTNASLYTKLLCTYGHYNLTPNATVVTSWGTRKAAEDNDGIQFYFSSGNISVGTFVLYGLDS